MLNLELIDNLYKGLTKEQQQDLIAQLFKKSKQTMSYFHRTKDISLSKLETLADFFHMPLDYFRANSSFKTQNVSGNNNYVVNVSVNTNLMMENDALRRENQNLKNEMESKERSHKEAIQSKEQVIHAKDQVIASQQRIIDSLTAATAPIK